ncbi:MAG: DUF3786 domain-containing protein [Desulfobacterales bacterium]|nr:DUF3786 domain-containing protein [Desulfobacterales bacterium]
MTHTGDPLDAPAPLTAGDLYSAARRPGVTFNNGSLRIPFFGATYSLSPSQVLGPDGTPPSRAVAGILHDYVTHAPLADTGENRFISFRELAGTGPLAVSFANNTNKTITTTFAGRLDRLEQAAARLSGIPEKNSDGYDLCIRFNALPGVPVHLLFNDAEDDFPAQCTLLLPAAIEYCLDRRAIFTLGTFLCGRLAGSTYTDR